MKANIILLFTLIVSFFNSCMSGYKKYSEEKANYTKCHIHLSYDTLTVNLKNDSIIFSKYAYQKVSGDDYLHCINEYSNCFELFNLSTKQKIYEKGVKELSGINKDVIFSFSLVNFDSIFILSNNLIILVDTAGDIIQKIPINDQPGYKYKIAPTGNFPISFDPVKQEILLPRYCTSCGSWKNTFYNTEIELGIIPKTKFITVYPVLFSRKYINNYYGFLFKANRVMVGNYSIYTFPVDPNIYRFNRVSGKLEQLGGVSGFQKNKIISLPAHVKSKSDIKFRHLLTSPFYGEIIYDKYNKLFYRVYYAGQKLKGNDGKYHTWADKKKHLMVFNIDFKLLTEIKLPNNDFDPGICIPTKNGLLFPLTTYKNKVIYSLSFYRYHIELQK